MSLVFTMPGKLGDALLEWPVAHRYCVENDLKCTVWLDEATCKPLVSLFESQPCVEKVELRSGVQNYTMGGQPWDFGLKTQDHLEHDIVHLGLRKFPTRQMTIETADSVPLRIQDRDAMANEPSIIAPLTTWKDYGNRLVLHGTYRHIHGSGVPTFWRFLSDRMEEFEQLFEEIVFIGSDAEVDRAVEVYPKCQGFKDGGDLRETAKLMLNSKLVIGTGSGMVALSGALKVPTIRVHDPIGDHPKIIWSNLGDRQWNLTEPELRKAWPEIRAELFIEATNGGDPGIAGGQTGSDEHQALVRDG